MRITRAGGAISALALISLFVFGGATSAMADTEAPTISPPVATETDAAVAPAISGMAGELATIVVTLTNSGATGAAYCTAVANYYGQWSCPAATGPGLAFGANTFSAAATSDDPVASPPSNTVVITRFGTTAPQLVSPASGITTFDPSPTLSGVGPEHGTLVVKNQDGAVLCTIPVIADDARWSCAPAEPLAIGDNGISLEATTFGSAVFTGSSTVTIGLRPPTLQYQLQPGAASATATGHDGAYVVVELYSVVPPEEQEGSATGYGYRLEQSCPVGSGGEGSAGFATAEVSSAVVPSGDAAATSTVNCDFGALAPGIWNVYSSQSMNGYYSNHQNDYFRVPVAPTITASTADQAVTLSGGGTAGDVVYVVSNAGAASCTSTVDTAGAWACSAVPATPGTHQYRAYQLDRGFVPIDDSEEPVGNTLSGFSAYSELAAVTVLAPPVVAPPTTVPTPPVTLPAKPPTKFVSQSLATLFHWVLSIAGADGPLHPGDSVTLGSDGLPQGSTVDIVLHSTPAVLGDTTVGTDGSFSKTVVIPADTEPGDHHFVVTVTPPGEAPSTVESPVTIVAAAVAPVAAPADATDDDADAAAGSAGGASTGHSRTDARNEPGTPSAFTDALPTLASLIENPVALALAAGVALAIMLLVALPTELLNSSLTSNLNRFGPFLARAETVVERATAWLNRVTRTPATASVILILASSIIFGFADPHYGFTLVSVRLTLALTIAMFIICYLASRVSGWIMRRRWGLESAISMQPIALVFAIVGVVVGRLLGFAPGFLIGLAIGLELVSQAKSAYRARAVMLQVGVVVALAILAWLGYSLTTALLAGTPGTFWSGLLQDTLVSVTAEGLTGMVLALLPLGFFDGRELWDHSKALWGGMFLVTGTAFALLVLPTALDGQDIGGNLVVWLIVLAAFAAVSLALWLYLRLTTKPEAEAPADQPSEQPSEQLHA